MPIIAQYSQDSHWTQSISSFPPVRIQTYTYLLRTEQNPPVHPHRHPQPPNKQYPCITPPNYVSTWQIFDNIYCITIKKKLQWNYCKENFLFSHYYFFFCLENLAVSRVSRLCNRAKMQMLLFFSTSSIFTADTGICPLNAPFIVDMSGPL